VAAPFRDRLPADLGATVMSLQTGDRFHAKQNRSTGRFRFDAPGGTISVYLKRHRNEPGPARLAGRWWRRAGQSPAAVEWAHLESVKRLRIAVPEPVAVGERVTDGAGIDSFLMVAELVGQRELNEALPVLAGRLDRLAFERFKRAVVRQMAGVAARLHNDRLYHNDFYLCHFFIQVEPVLDPGGAVTLIDLHRLARHRWLRPLYRSKDLGQLLYSTHGVAGVTSRDVLRFWSHYHRQAGLSRRSWQLALVRLRAARYRHHSR
jgi:heptose I phosphotransferase